MGPLILPEHPLDLIGNRLDQVAEQGAPAGRRSELLTIDYLDKKRRRFAISILLLGSLDFLERQLDRAEDQAPEGGCPA